MSTVKSILKLIPFSLLGLILLLNSCALMRTKEIGHKSTSYVIKEAPKAWEKIPPGGSDHAFANSKTNSIITANSLCGRYESTSLRQLTNNILSGLDQSSIEESATVPYVGREALRTKARARMDGIPVYLIIKTVRKNECIYDFILISSSDEIRRADSKEFDRMLKSINIE